MRRSKTFLLCGKGKAGFARHHSKLRRDSVGAESIGPQAGD